MGLFIRLPPNMHHKIGRESRPNMLISVIITCAPKIKPSPIEKGISKQSIDTSNDSFASNPPHHHSGNLLTYARLSLYVPCAVDGRGFALAGPTAELITVAPMDPLPDADPTGPRSSRCVMVVATTGPVDVAVLGRSLSPLLVLVG